MAHYASLGSYRFDANVDDVRGTTVRGLEDEKLGTVDDVIFDHNSGEIRYVVIDSGGWLGSPRFLIMAGRIFADPKRPDEFQVGVTKQQIENLPPYDEKSLGSEDEWRKYEENTRKPGMTVQCSTAMVPTGISLPQMMRSTHPVQLDKLRVAAP